ncbi:hypothetical protein FOA52_004328 [Chlamydomonas sp. UWO 241]|nr:hypothetical protein FOA52_004328 [Chlamydomonas sp. UWO 241]
MAYPYGAPPPGQGYAYPGYAAPAPYPGQAPYGAGAPPPYGIPPAAGAAPYPGAYPGAPASAPAPGGMYPTMGAVGSMGAAPGHYAPPAHDQRAQPALAHAYVPPAQHPHAPPHQAAHPMGHPNVMPPAGGPRRKALLIGCGYPGTSAALKGCINDAQCMAYALKKHCKYTDQDIVLLRDDGQERGADFRSTRASIYKGIQWLLTDMRQGSCLFFHFSGHGSQKRAMGRDEADGMDETICPSDFKTAGQIIDNELNQRLVNPLPPGVVMHCVVDACHSGTALDLNYSTEYDPRHRTFVWRNEGGGNPHAMAAKGTRGGTCVQFGACRDSQVAQDTSALAGGTFTGAATYSLIQALEHGGVRQTYSQIMSSMTATLHKATAGGNANASAAGDPLSALLGGFGGGGGGRREPQTPVMSCDKPIDLNIQLMFPQ